MGHVRVTSVISCSSARKGRLDALVGGQYPVMEGNVVKHSSRTTEKEDLRIHPRYRVDIRLKLITGLASETKTFYGRGSDISEGGMRVFVPVELEIGEAVMLELALPYSERTFQVRGILRNRLGFSYGVEYAPSTTLEERHAIARACRALSLVQ